MKTVYIAENINGDILGVASTHQKAIDLLDKKYGDAETMLSHMEEHITPYEIDEFYYK